MIFFNSNHQRMSRIVLGFISLPASGREFFVSSTENLMYALQIFKAMGRLTMADFAFVRAEKETIRFVGRRDVHT